MKKLLATLLMGAVTITGVLGFTACNKKDNGETDNKEPEKQIVTTVTAEEWKTAVASVYDLEHSVECVSNFVGGAPDGTTYHYWYDSTKKITHLNIDWHSEEDEATDIYYWRGTDGKPYTSDGEEKYVLDEEDLEDAFKMCALSYTGNSIPYYMVQADVFTSAVYDEESKEYKGTFEYAEKMWGEEMAGSYNYTLKFEDKKLVKLVAEVSEGGEPDFTITVEYYYGSTVTVPQNILDIEVTE